MVRITEVQVRQAEENAAEQDRVRDEAAAALEANPYSDVAALRHTEESRLAAQLRANARELREAFDAQVAEEMRRASRPALEAAAAAEMKAAGVELAEREQAFVEALAGAQQALVELVAAGAAYNTAVESHTDVLAAAGVDFRGGETGGERTVLGHARLKVDGRVYEPVNEAAVPAWVLRRVAEARVSNCHHLVGALTGTAVAAEQRVPTVLAKVPGPERAARPRPWMLADAYRALRGTK